MEKLREKHKKVKIQVYSNEIYKENICNSLTLTKNRHGRFKKDGGSRK